MIRSLAQRGPLPQARPTQGRPLIRHLARQNVARRKAGERKVRQPGRLPRLLAPPLKLAASLCLCSALLLGGWGLLAMSPLFRVRQAQVLGTSHLSRLEVLSLAGVGARDSLLSLRVGQIERRLMTHPWVERARVRRRFPGAVQITVSERLPRFLALAEGHAIYLDGQMRPVASLAGQAAPDLPWLTGLSRADLVRPDAEVQRLLAGAASLLAELKQSGLGRASEVHLDRIWGLSLVLSDLAAPVRVGFKDFGPRLARLRAVLADLKKRGELGRVTLIDLEEGRRVVVRLGREPA